MSYCQGELTHVVSSPLSLEDEFSFGSCTLHTRNSLLAILISCVQCSGFSQLSIGQVDIFCLCRNFEGKNFNNGRKTTQFRQKFYQCPPRCEVHRKPGSHITDTHKSRPGFISYILCSYCTIYKLQFPTGVGTIDRANLESYQLRNRKVMSPGHLGTFVDFPSQALHNFLNSKSIEPWSPRALRLIRIIPPTRQGLSTLRHSIGTAALNGQSVYGMLLLIEVPSSAR